MLDISGDVEVSTIEIRKNEPRLIFALQHEWDGDAEANLDPVTESRYGIGLDQDAIATSGCDHNPRLASIKRFAGHEITAACKLCLGLYAPNPMSRASHDCAGRQLYFGASFLTESE